MLAGQRLQDRILASRKQCMLGWLHAAVGCQLLFVLWACLYLPYANCSSWDTRGSERLVISVQLWVFLSLHDVVRIHSHVVNKC